MKQKYEEFSEKLKAMGHPVRLQIISGVIKNECNVSQIQANLGLPQSTISQHLQILKSNKIIKGRREGTRVCYQVIDENVKKIIKLID
ncbi:MAG: winged helix-turn-helix transcriptional regulator [Spirochaetales bacterium]|nr:winged helix-turn-helix transcriptional regulator [Spirochaetales bacterium]